MTLNDVLVKRGYDLNKVLVMRHKPPEKALNKVLPWLASERPDLFKAYQQTQGVSVEKSVHRADLIASFIRHGPKHALFVGLFRKTGEKTITRDEFWQIPAYIEMRDKYGMKGFTHEESRSTTQWFDMEPVEDFYPEWKGKLIVEWPKPAIVFARKAKTGLFSITAILEESDLIPRMQRWDEITLTWDELHLMPKRLKDKLKEWRGIYFIFDTELRKGYVGKASGEFNIRDRWEHYMESGHGDNSLLKPLDPKNFIFSILQILSHDASEEEVLRAEVSWKRRLHTRKPFGLNGN